MYFDSDTTISMTPRRLELFFMYFMNAVGRSWCAPPKKNWGKQCGMWNVMAPPNNLFIEIEKISSNDEELTAAINNKNSHP